MQYHGQFHKFTTHLINHHDSAFMIRVRSVKVDGTVDSNNMVLLCHFEDGMPVFGEIKHIIMTHSKEVLLCYH